MCEVVIDKPHFRFGRPKLLREFLWLRLLDATCSGSAASNSNRRDNVSGIFPVA